jgi:tyrosine-protein phosphatase YwqE
MIDLSFDFHAHVLPGCDHGSDSLDVSRRQLQMAHDAGVKHICATPHFYPQNENVDSFLTRRQKTYGALRPYLVETGMQLSLGAEVLICEGMENMPDLAKLCREGTDELLLEMPFYAWSSEIVRALYGILEREDITVVTAHVDRYPAENIEKLGMAGVHMQVNADAIACHPLRKRQYLTWVKNGWIRYLGSDIHMLGDNYKYWVKASKAIRRSCK